MSPLLDLWAAEAILRDPSRWCRDDFAIARDGRAVSPTSSDAVAWCVVGAVIRVAHPHPCIDAIHYLQKAAPGYITDWQARPDVTHANVLDVIYQARMMAWGEQ